MWSNQYVYYNIQSDPDFSQKVRTEKVIRLLSETNYLIRKNGHSFENSETFPWVNITMALTKNGNFNDNNTSSEYVNLISIVCSRRTIQSVYTDVFLSIARKLKWKLYLEEDDSGNENIEIV